MEERAGDDLLSEYDLKARDAFKKLKSWSGCVDRININKNIFPSLMTGIILQSDLLFCF